MAGLYVWRDSLDFPAFGFAHTITAILIWPAAVSLTAGLLIIAAAIRDLNLYTVVFELFKEQV